MPQTTERVLKFAIEAFRQDLEDLLDDPSWLYHEGEGYAAEYLAEKREVARDLGMNFDTLVEELGTEYEVARLRDYESGEFEKQHPRAPRKM